VGETNLTADERLCIHLAGIVQGVGMRYFVKDLAGKMGLGGFVQNTPDGRVKCMVQGDKAKLELFVTALKNAPRGRVTDVTVEPYTAVAEVFSHFDIRY